MHTIDLVDRSSTTLTDIGKLKPRELLYVRLKSITELSFQLMVLIKKFSHATSEVILSIPGEEFSLTGIREDLLKLGIKGFALRLRHDSKLVHSFQLFRKELPIEKDLIVEFEASGDLKGLASTIIEVYASGASWIVLNPGSPPTPDNVEAFTRVIEDLKIRGPTKLNVYFSFWTPESREWDIKTKNTFGGLEQIHIDISNRCTHSCVFCPLYGPEALDEIKRRSGGTIPQSLAEHMRKEINPDKCLEIINGLPWTVDAIQFGGFGDPLMHEKAIDFITAGRSRGFRVEVLSNMEYLEEDDIMKIHSLGGKGTHELMFIANVSGGDMETYLKTRPKQTSKNFEQVKRNLKLISDLRKQNNGIGANITLMCVMTALNCTTLEKVSDLATEVGASHVWFKPFEYHLNIHEALNIPKHRLKEMARSLALAVSKAESENIQIFYKDYCEAIITQFAGDLKHV